MLLVNCEMPVVTVLEVVLPPLTAAVAVSTSDKVAVELSPYDLNRGRIVYRYK